jgi:hypothetical protein
MTHHKIRALKTNNLITLGCGETCRQKDVKNEGWPDYVLENTDEADKISTARPLFLGTEYTVGATIEAKSACY